MRILMLFFELFEKFVYLEKGLGLPAFDDIVTL